MPKAYVLEMFPYPSGRLHMGHVRNYAMGDVVARYRLRQRLQRAAPDGLGRVRPAGRERRHRERASAAPTGRCQNIQAMKDQFEAAGPRRFDWSREIATCEPDYYAHQQRIFLEVAGARPGLSPHGEGELGSGRATPCSPTSRWSTAAAGAPAQSVERRELEQWFFRITELRPTICSTALDTPRPLARQGPHHAGRTGSARARARTFRWRARPKPRSADGQGHRWSSRPGPTRCSAQLSSRWRLTIR